MARLARIIIPHYSQYIIQRGNRRQDVFFKESDYLIGRLARKPLVENVGCILGRDLKKKKRLFSFLLDNLFCNRGLTPHRIDSDYGAGKIQLF